MPNPMIPVGTLNRVRASVKFTSHSELNVSASFLAKEGVELSFQGNITEFFTRYDGSRAVAAAIHDFTGACSSAA